MSRAIWSGAISFGLVSVPVKLHSAIADKNIRLHLVTPDGECRLREKLYCPDTGKEYDFSDAARGYEIAPNQYVLLDEEELKNLRPESGDVIQLESFVDLEDIDPIYFNRTYYLEPVQSGIRPYAVLLKALEDTKKAGLGGFVMRGNEYLGAVRPGDGVLCLDTMHFADEIRQPEEEISLGKEKVDKRELALATQLIESWTAKFDPGKYHSSYREKLRQAIEKKAKGQKISKAPMKSEKKGKVIDLMSALKSSLKQPPSRSVTRSHPRSKRRKSA